MRVKIYYSNEQDKFRVSMEMRHLIKQTVLTTLAYEGFDRDAEVSVTFTDNEGIRKLNSEYRERDSATDVLSFPIYSFEGDDMPDDCDPVSLGDIVLSLERAKSQAEEYGHSFEREAAFLTAHSVLHLLGYDHEKSEADDADMRHRQRDIMEIMHLTR